MINPNSIKFGVPHPSWQTSGYSTQSVKMAISKVRFLTDTIMTGEKINKMFNENPKCQCGFPIEDRFHILLDSQIYNDLREMCITSITSVIQNSHPEITDTTIRNRTVMAHLILDPSWYQISIGTSQKSLPNILNKTESNKIEVIGRAFCFRIYKRRFDNLSYINSDDNETSTDVSFSVHDTESESSNSSNESGWED